MKHILMNAFSTIRLMPKTVIIYTVKEENGEEIIRLISARKATLKIEKLLSNEKFIAAVAEKIAAQNSELKAV